MNAMTDAYDWQDRTLVDPEGEKIGKVTDIYTDQHTNTPEWALVHTGLFANKSHFVPLAGAMPKGEDIEVRVAKDAVKNAPSIEADGELSVTQERELFEHYGVPYTDEGSVTAQGPPPAAPQERAQPTGVSADAGHDTSGPNTDQAMTRSEEELLVGKTRREAGRVRLRKYVVTEQIQTTVPVQREEVRLEREPITQENVGQAMGGPAISEEEHEIVLHEEVPVIEKQVVAKERVRLEKDSHTHEHEIDESVRKEQIETEGDLRR